MGATVVEPRRQSQRCVVVVVVVAGGAGVWCEHPALPPAVRRALTDGQEPLGGNDSEVEVTTIADGRQVWLEATWHAPTGQ